MTNLLTDDKVTMDLRTKLVYKTSKTEETVRRAMVSRYNAEKLILIETLNSQPCKLSEFLHREYIRIYT